MYTANTPDFIEVNDLVGKTTLEAEKLLLRGTIINDDEIAFIATSEQSGEYFIEIFGTGDDVVLKESHVAKAILTYVPLLIAGHSSRDILIADSSGYLNVF